MTSLIPNMDVHCPSGACELEYCTMIPKLNLDVRDGGFLLFDVVYEVNDDKTFCPSSAAKNDC